MEFIVEVNQEDISKGVKNSPCNCPIALALKRLFPSAFRVYVNSYNDIQSGSWWSANISLKGTSLGFDLSPEATTFANNFDFGRPVEPFSFTVKL